jgi:DNA invertase Pin-like site-specific DNA recombinase
MQAPEIYSDEIRRYCGYRRFVLGELYSDIDCSGYRNSGYRNSEKRPALNRLIQERSQYSAVVVPKLSRFGRSLRHLSELFELFDNDGIDLIFLDIGVDTGTSHALSIPMQLTHSFCSQSRRRGGTVAGRSLLACRSAPSPVTPP